MWIGSNTKMTQQGTLERAITQNPRIMTICGFHQKLHCLWPSISTLFTFVQRTFFLRSCSSFKCNFANLSHSTILFLGTRGFLLSTLSNKSCFYNFFLPALSWPLAFSVLSQDCRRFCFFVFAFVLFIVQWLLWVRSTPGQIGRCLKS